MRFRLARRSVWIGLVAALLALMGTVPVHTVKAQSAGVTIAGFSFQPATLTVSVGTTVTWTNNDSVAHTSTSDTGVWDSGAIATGASYSHTFTQAGSFPYHCSIHPNMHGMIVVQESATAAPTSTTAPSASATTGPSVVTPTAGSVTTATSVPLAALPALSGAMAKFKLGPVSSARTQSWLGYYDGHLDTYVNTDVSNRPQALALHINFSPALAQVGGKSTSPMYLVQGRAPSGQLAVFGSEPGERDYSPIWREIVVRWRAAASPVLLVRDDQIAQLASKGKLTMHPTRVMLNAPILRIGK